MKRKQFRVGAVTTVVVVLAVYLVASSHRASSHRGGKGNSTLGAPVQHAPVSVGWANCSRKRKLSLSRKDDGLMELLRGTSGVFKEHNVFYALAKGTLLGAWRANDINPFEVDVDLIVNKSFVITHELRCSLWEKGLIIFKHDIFRVCEYTATPEQRPRGWVPWYRDDFKLSCLYVDLYPTPMATRSIFDIVTGKNISWHKPITTTQVRIRDQPFVAFERDFSMQLIHLDYGEKWREPPPPNKHGHAPWKQAYLDQWIARDAELSDEERNE
jgi:hypothetical protein